MNERRDTAVHPQHLVWNVDYCVQSWDRTFVILGNTLLTWKKLTHLGNEYRLWERLEAEKELKNQRRQKAIPVNSKGARKSNPEANVV